MKKATLCLLVLSLATGFASESNRKIVFSRGESIWIANPDGTEAKKVTRGSSPDISPDGTRIAFTTDEPDKKTGPVRHIAVVEIAAGKTTVFKEMPGDNCFGPVWSHDGRQIAFYILAEKNWQIGVVKSDGSDFHYLKKANANGLSYFSVCWSSDDKSIFCQDLEHLFRFSLDGSLIKQWDIGQLTGGSTMNSGDRIDISPNGQRLIFDVDLPQEHSRTNWDGPQPAIYVLDLKTEKTTRVTGKSDFAWDPCWLTNDELLCIIQGEHENEPSLYRTASDAWHPKLVAKHARDPSAQAP
jgi:TolB protein